MKDKAIGIIYLHSPSNIVYSRYGGILPVKKYKNGGSYVNEGRKQYSLGKLPKLTDDRIREFKMVFC